MKKFYNLIFASSFVSLIALASLFVTAFLNIRSLSVVSDIDKMLSIIKRFSGISIDKSQEVISQLTKIEGDFKIAFLIIIFTVILFLALFTLYTVIRSLVCMKEKKMPKHLISIIINVVLLFISIKFYGLIAISGAQMILYILFIILTIVNIGLFSFVSFLNFKRDPKYILNDPTKTILNIIPDAIRFVGAILVLILVFYGTTVISLIIIDNWITAQVLKYDLSQDIINGITNLINYDMKFNDIFGTNIALFNFSLSDFSITEPKLKLLLSISIGTKINQIFSQTTSSIVDTFLYGNNYTQMMTIYIASIVGTVTLLVPKISSNIDLIKRVIVTVVSLVISFTALFVLNTSGFIANASFATAIIKLLQPMMWVLLVLGIILLVDVSKKSYDLFKKGNND